MNGIVIVDKPQGWTSQDVVSKLRGVFKTRRIGHGGTLDPLATGVLPVFVGRATRGVEFFEHAEKTYEAVLHLGLSTDTEDITPENLARLMKETHTVLKEAGWDAPSYSGSIESRQGGWIYSDSYTGEELDALTLEELAEEIRIQNE